jgi:hypothetical protein
MFSNVLTGSLPNHQYGNVAAPQSVAKTYTFTEAVCGTDVFGQGRGSSMAFLDTGK